MSSYDRFDPTAASAASLGGASAVPHVYMWPLIDDDADDGDALLFASEHGDMDHFMSAVKAAVTIACPATGAAPTSSVFATLLPAVQDLARLTMGGTASIATYHDVMFLTGPDCDVTIYSCPLSEMASLNDRAAMPPATVDVSASGFQPKSSNTAPSYDPRAPPPGYEKTEKRTGSKADDRGCLAPLRSLMSGLWPGSTSGSQRAPSSALAEKAVLSQYWNTLPSPASDESKRAGTWQGTDRP